MADTHTERPSPLRIMEILKEAGEEGILAPDVARQFTIDDPPVRPGSKISTPAMANLQRRLSWTNQILTRFLNHGWAVRRPDRSPYYRRVSAYRWFITAAGADHLALGMAEGLRAARAAQREQWRADWRERRRRAESALTQAYVDYDPKTTPKCERQQVVRELRGLGCTLAEIGGVFGVTRERIRQIQVGWKEPPCRCPACTDREWFEVGDGESAG